MLSSPFQPTWRCRSPPRPKALADLDGPRAATARRAGADGSPNYIAAPPLRQSKVVADLIVCISRPADHDDAVRCRRRTRRRGRGGGRAQGLQRVRNRRQLAPGVEPEVRRLGCSRRGVVDRLAPDADGGYRLAEVLCQARSSRPPYSGALQERLQARRRRWSRRASGGGLQGCPRGVSDPGWPRPPNAAPFARPVALHCGKPVWSWRRGTRGGGRRVCHGAPATTAQDHSSLAFLDCS